jgi:hypothetical protein
MPKPASTSVPDPTSLASSLGAQRSSWWKLGDGPWYGNVTDQNGIEWEFEQLTAAKSWRATSVAAQVFNASSLELLLKKVLG